jgi:hypothetical protein
MAMVQVTNKKDETIHWMRLDPGFAALFLLYRYRCWKCQFCNTITSPIPNTISAGGSTLESSSNHYTNEHANADSPADTDATASSHANIPSKSGHQ